MVRRWLATCMFMLLMNEVCLEKTIVAVEGGTIILPCSYSGAAPKREDINVFWRYNDKNIVYNIVKSEVSVEEQDPAYKDRTESFPDEYAKGNFSIKLSSVGMSDQGMYSCITFAEDTQSLQLHVERAPQPAPAPKNKSLESRSVLSSLIFTVLLGYSLL